ncbi:MAG: molecular chaperone HtpG [Oscillospiraceae bacterium]|jgi:molecular chaperone HtpG|nr:molecular chaperone HtpG [Oscillospiraceae bacterium]
MPTQVKQFQAESKRLLDLMIHSIYTHKEIFLRELISNASDAMDKRYYNAMQSGETGLDRSELEIGLAADKEARILVVSDAGCGMDAAELEDNLGIIAKSGSLEFKKGLESAEDIDVIGQFGVGFYAAFMVADEITVLTRKPGADKAYRWHSVGADGYTIEEAAKAEPGTEIILHIKPNAEEENYDEFLESYRLRELVKRYSDYIRYPIRMDVESSRPKTKPDTASGADAADEVLLDGADAAEEPEWETYTERQTLNSMSPLWKKHKSEITAEEYEAFYKDNFHDYEPPLKSIHSSTEGLSSYTALLFIPSQAPYNYYHKDYEKGLKLYASGVLIMEKCKDLLPDCFSFVRGLVDSQDLSLNISREMLQQDRQLKNIAKHLEKKIKSELKALMEDDREKYEKFWKAFGLQLKFALYQSFGMQRELLADLLLFQSTGSEKPVSLKEYAAAMPEGQKAIYYAGAASPEKLRTLPQAEKFTDKGYSILCLTDDVDEFLLKVLRDYEPETAEGEEQKHLAFRSIADAAADIADTEEKEELAAQIEEHKAVLEALQEKLAGKVSEVTLTNKLKSHAVCLSTKGDISLEMERVMQQQPHAGDVPIAKAEKVLEINAASPVLSKLREKYAADPSAADTYAELLYGQALLLEGFQPDDPAAFCAAVASLMA